MGRFDDLLGPEADSFDAAVFYPGSKQRRDQPRPHMETVEDPFEGLTPRHYTVSGQDVEFFTIGQLAHVLGRQAVTLRKWEADGVLPKATFVAPNPSRDPRAKRRLYSRDQAVGIVRIALEEGLTTGRQIGSTNFTERVTELFRELKSK